MKTRLLVLFTSAAIIAGCAKTDKDTYADEIRIPMTFETEFAQLPDNKSYLQSAESDRYNVVWHAGDKVAFVPVGKTGDIASVTEGNYFTTAEGGQTATFEGQTYDADSYVGIYPVDGLDYIHDGDKLIYKNIYEHQTACNGNLDKDMLISVSNPTPKGEKMYFYNACGLIKFTIPENRTNITKVAFRGSNEEKLAGRIKISYGTTGVTSVFQERYIGQKSTNTLTLSNADGSVLTPGTYYMVATPTKLEKGFTIAMYGSDGKRYIKSSEATTNEIERSGILDLGTLSFGESAPAHSKMFFISEGDNWSFVEMTRHPIDLFTFRHGTYVKSGQFKFGTQSGVWDDNYKALDMDNADCWSYEDARFEPNSSDNDFKWYITATGEGKPCRIILDMTTGVEKMYITEFSGYNELWLVGSALGNWDMSFAKEMEKDTDDGFTYSWSGDLAVGELKITLNKLLAFDGKEWLMAPAKGQALTVGTDQDILYVDNYPDIDHNWSVTEAGNYTITINTLTEKMTVVKNEVTSDGQ